VCRSPCPRIKLRQKSWVPESHVLYEVEADGQGVEDDPVLVMASFKTEPTLIETSIATLELGYTVLVRSDDKRWWR
jgi:hypothetical protein